jgi:hypothetical protein
VILNQDADQRIGEMARPERRGVSTRTVVGEAKAKVSTLDLAGLLCGPGQLRQLGERWVARCPLPQHQDRSPSFTVYPETDSFFCFGCLVGGDVIELARHAWGYDKAEVATAAAILLMEFGHEVPPRPTTWFARQERQAPVLDALENILVRSTRRRLFKRWAPYIAAIEDDAERHREEAQIWDELLPVAKMVVARRRS